MLLLHAKIERTEEELNFIQQDLVGAEGSYDRQLQSLATLESEVGSERKCNACCSNLLPSSDTLEENVRNEEKCNCRISSGILTRLSQMRREKRFRLKLVQQARVSAGDVKTFWQGLCADSDGNNDKTFRLGAWTFDDPEPSPLAEEHESSCDDHSADDSASGDDDLSDDPMLDYSTTSSSSTDDDSSECGSDCVEEEHDLDEERAGHRVVPADVDRMDEDEDHCD